MNDELITLSELAAGGVSALNRLRLLIDRTQRAAIPMNGAWVSLTAEIERALVDQSRGQDTLMRDVQTALSLLAKRTEECEALRARLAAAEAELKRLGEQEPVAVFKGAHDGRFVIDWLHGYIPPVNLALYAAPIPPAAAHPVAVPDGWIQMGVGDGSGQLFVYGPHDAIKECQRKLLSTSPSAPADDVVRDARLVAVWDWCRLTAQDFGNGNARQQAVAKAYLGIAHHIKSKYFRGCKDRDMFAILAASAQSSKKEGEA